MGIALEQLCKNALERLQKLPRAAQRSVHTGYWRRLNLGSIDMSAWHPSDEPPVFKEVKALLKVSVIVLAAAGLLALISSVPTGPTRGLVAIVVSDIEVGFSQTSRHVIAQLQSGDKVEVRLRNNTVVEPGQSIEITEHNSALSNFPTYSYVEKPAE